MLLIVLALRSSAAFWPFSEDVKNGKIWYVPVSCLPFSCPLERKDLKNLKKVNKLLEPGMLSTILFPIV